MKRKPTQHELDCALLLDYIIKRTPQTSRDTDALMAFSRIERRAQRTSVSGKDYVVHINDSPFNVYCGRRVVDVNSTTLEEASKDLESEQWCKRCVARIKKEKILHAR